MPPHANQRKTYMPEVSLVVILVFFAAIKVIDFTYHYSDENIYFYMGKLVSDGKMPYRDFFLSHTPLDIIIDALAIKIFGFNYTVLKCLSIITSVLCGYLLFRIVSEHYDEWVGVFSTFLFLFSMTVMRSTSFATGVNTTVLFMLASYFFLLRRKHFESGILLGIATLAGLYAVILLGAYVIYLALIRAKVRSEILPFMMGFSIIFVAFNLFFYLQAGQKYVDSILLYHLNKPETSASNISIFIRLIKENFPLFLPLFLIPLLHSKGDKLEQIALPAIISICYVLFLLAVRPLYDFYFGLLFPFLAILSAKVFHYIKKSPRMKTYATVVFALLMAYTLWSIGKYIQSESPHLMHATEISKYVKDTSSPNDRIFGDSTTVPLIALLSERRIAMDEVDTNFLRFPPRTNNLNELLSRLDDEKDLKYFIISRFVGIGSFPQTSNYLRINCRLMRKYSEVNYALEIYDCSNKSAATQQPPAAATQQSTVCK